jgi:hypothetical protein
VVVTPVIVVAVLSLGVRCGEGRTDDEGWPAFLEIAVLSAT